MNENDRAAYLIVGLFVLTFLMFVAGVYGLVVHEWMPR